MSGRRLDQASIQIFDAWSWWAFLRTAIFLYVRSFLNVSDLDTYGQANLQCTRLAYYNNNASENEASERRQPKRKEPEASTFILPDDNVVFDMKSGIFLIFIVKYWVSFLSYNIWLGFICFRHTCNRIGGDWDWWYHGGNHNDIGEHLRLECSPVRPPDDCVTTAIVTSTTSLTTTSGRWTTTIVTTGSRWS